MAEHVHEWRETARGSGAYHCADIQCDAAFYEEDGDEPVCSPLDDVQDHHDWAYPHGGALGVCRQCGALSQAWEE